MSRPLCIVAVPEGLLRYLCGGCGVVHFCASRRALRVSRTFVTASLSSLNLNLRHTLLHSSILHQPSPNLRVAARSSMFDDRICYPVSIVISLSTAYCAILKFQHASTAVAHTQVSIAKGTQKILNSRHVRILWFLDRLNVKSY